MEVEWEEKRQGAGRKPEGCGKDEKEDKRRMIFEFIAGFVSNSSVSAV